MDWVANMSDPSGLALASNRPAKLAERVAEALKRDISAIGWPVGQVFGSEAQLMERYGIGLATLREAIRQLERHGVANMRRGSGSGSGSGGGLVISRPARDSAALALATYLELIDVSFGELYEARALIESQAVLLAAERLDEPDIPRARALIELLGQEQPGCFNAELRLLADVRDFICRVSGNAAISLILEALQCVTVSGRTPSPDAASGVTSPRPAPLPPPSRAPRCRAKAARAGCLPKSFTRTPLPGVSTISDTQAA